MKKTLLDALTQAAKPLYPDNDPSHDWNHICRVLSYACNIQAKEGGDLEIIVAGALFHDCVNLPKYHPESHRSADLSAEAAARILRTIEEFPSDKIPQVMTGISEHSFSKRLTPTTLESQIIQDADRLESTGIISLMRTFASCGIMGRPFFDWQDPFCENRSPDPKNFGLDLVFSRLLKVSETLNTTTAKKIAEESDKRIHQFIALLKEETQNFPQILQEIEPTPEPAKPHQTAGPEIQ